MTHIDTYSHRIPHKLTQLHTNTHILHTFTHKLPHLWVGHKKSHVYIYIYIYIYNKFIHFNTYIQHNTTSYSQLLPTNKEKKFFNQKTKQTNENQNQIIHSIIDSFIQRLKDSMKSIEIPRIPKSSKNR